MKVSKIGVHIMYHRRDTVVEIRQMLEIGYKDTTQVDEHFYSCVATSVNATQYKV